MMTKAKIEREKISKCIHDHEAIIGVTAWHRRNEKSAAAKKKKRHGDGGIANRKRGVENGVAAYPAKSAA